MVSFKEVEEQLKHIGCNYLVWGRSEIHELTTVLMPGEKIAQAVNGYYEGGFALLVITDYRVLLVDRKPMLLTIEDIRYDMVSEVDYNTQIFAATLRVFTPMRNLVFKSWSIDKLRKSMSYVQQRVLEIRQHHLNLTPLIDTGAQQEAEQQPETQPSMIAPYIPINPYTKVPMLSRRRRYPSFYTAPTE